MDRLNKKSGSGDVRKTASIIIVSLCLLAMLPIAVISRYNHPVRDDYQYSRIAVEEAVRSGGGIADVIAAAYETAKKCYTSLDGKYTASFIFSLHPGTFSDDEGFYSLTAGILILVLFLGTWYFLSAFFLLLEWDNKYLFTVSMLIVLTQIEGMPRPFEGLFWFCGGIAYTFYFGIFLLQCGILLNIYNFYSHGKNTALITLLACINAMFLAGGNNITSFIIVPLNVFIILISIFVRKNKIILNYALTGLCSITGFMIVYLSPSTSGRGRLYERPGLFKAVIISLINTGRDVIHYTRFTAILLLVVIFLLIYPNIRVEKSNFPFKWSYEILIFAVSVCLFAGAEFVPYYVMGNAGPDRVFDMRFCLYIILAVVNMLYIAGIIRKASLENECVGRSIALVSKGKYYKQAFLMTVILSVICISIFSNRVSTSYKCIEELISGEARRYHIERLNLPKDMDTINTENRPEMFAYG